MIRHVPRGKWKQLKGETKKQWGKMTDDDADVFDGEKEKLAGKAQEGFGQVEDKVDRAYNHLGSAPGD